ncbi:hypothetical protein BDF19DRAFT_429275 [Syncephalis fuscata]|nr:hypothetical protein BDF19DRAFT_429275 [Syncephalis fuscata]
MGDIVFDGYLCIKPIPSSPKLDKYNSSKKKEGTIAINTANDINSTDGVGSTNENGDNYQAIPSVLMTSTELNLLSTGSNSSERNSYTTLLFWLEGQVSPTVVADQMELICRLQPRLRQIPVTAMKTQYHRHQCTCKEGENNGWHTRGLAHWSDISYQPYPSSSSSEQTTALPEWHPRDNIEERWLLLPPPSPQHPSLMDREQAAIQSCYGEFHSRHHAFNLPLWRVQLMHGLENQTIMALAVHQCIMDIEGLLQTITTAMSLSANSINSNNDTAPNVDCDEKSTLLKDNTFTSLSYGALSADTHTVASTLAPTPWHSLILQTSYQTAQAVTQIIYTWCRLMYSLAFLSVYWIRLIQTKPLVWINRRSQLKYTGWSTPLPLSAVQTVCDAYPDTDINDVILACIIEAYISVRSNQHTIQSIGLANELNTGKDASDWLLQLPISLREDSNSFSFHQTQSAYVHISGKGVNSTTDRLEAARQYRQIAHQQAPAAFYMQSFNAWNQYTENCELQVLLPSTSTTTVKDEENISFLYLKGETLPYYRVQSWLVHSPTIGPGKLSITVSTCNESIYLAITADATDSGRAIAQQIIEQFNNQFQQITTSTCSSQ